MERKREGEREGPSVTTYEVLCLVSLFFFKYRKTAFGLNLKEAENGIAEALGRKLL